MIQFESIDEVSQLRGRLQEIYHHLARLQGQWDCAVGALRNPDLSHPYFRLYFALIAEFPELLEGQEIDFRVRKVRDGTGTGETTTSRFFADMQQANAFAYRSGDYDRQNRDRVAHLIPNPGVFNAPWDINTRRYEIERKKREEEAKKKTASKQKQGVDHDPCPDCGSTRRDYWATPECRDCGHVFGRQFIPGEQILEGKYKESDDQAGQLPVIPGPELLIVQAPIATQVGMIGRHPLGIPCPGCGTVDMWQARIYGAGRLGHECARCFPE